MRLDGLIVEKGTLNTNSGASLTIQGVLDHLQARAVARAAAATKKETRESPSAQRHLYRETETNGCVLVRHDVEQPRVSRAYCLALRGVRSTRLVSSRRQERLTARHRPMWTPRLPLPN